MTSLESATLIREFLLLFPLSLRLIQCNLHASERLTEARYLNTNSSWSLTDIQASPALLYDRLIVSRGEYPEASSSPRTILVSSEVAWIPWFWKLMKVWGVTSSSCPYNVEIFKRSTEGQLATQRTSHSSRGGVGGSLQRWVTSTWVCSRNVGVLTSSLFSNLSAVYWSQLDVGLKFKELILQLSIQPNIYYWGISQKGIHARKKTCSNELSERT